MEDVAENFWNFSGQGLTCQARLDNMLNMRRESFTVGFWVPPPRGSSVYLLTASGQVVYVGETACLRGRMHTHKLITNERIDFVLYARIGAGNAVVDRDVRRSVESVLIDLFQPMLNRGHRLLSTAEDWGCYQAHLGHDALVDLLNLYRIAYPKRWQLPWLTVAPEYVPDEKRYQVRVQDCFDLTVAELFAAYYRYSSRRHAAKRYCKTQLHRIGRAIEVVIRKYADLSVIDFDPPALIACRQSMIERGWDWRYVNHCIHVIRACFRWGASKSHVCRTASLRLEIVGNLRQDSPNGSAARAVEANP